MTLRPIISRSGGARADRAWRVRVVALGAFLLLSAGCDRAPRKDVVLNSWFDAIHARDWQKLARFDANAPEVREGEPFDAWSESVAESLETYIVQRDQGRFDAGDRGYALVMATQVGRGTFWQIEREEGPPSAPSVELRLSFGYSKVSLEGLRRGSTIYLLGRPLGTIHSIVLRRGENKRMDLLDHASIGVEMTASDVSHPGDSRWKVRRAHWIEGSATSRSEEWVF